MICHLHIENYALIERLDIDLFPGFSVITGETGAGKSILLGAIGLLCGRRAETRVIKAGRAKCVVEAEFDAGGLGLEGLCRDIDFDFDGTRLTLRREVTSAGKTRSFANDTPVTLRQMGQIGERLLDVHSQHQTLLLSDRDFQTGVLDAFAGHAELLARYGRAFAEWQQTLDRLHSARDTQARAARERDYVQYQFDELTEARLERGEQASLEAELRTLAHADDIRAALGEAAAALDAPDYGGEDTAAALPCLSRARAALEAVSALCGSATAWAERVESARIDLEDLSRDIAAAASDIAADPRRKEVVEQRLDALYALCAKHHADDADALIAVRDDYAAQLGAFEDSEQDIERLEQAAAELEKRLRGDAALITAHRQSAADTLAAAMNRAFPSLALPHARFSVTLATDPGRLTASGADTVDFLFAANRGAQPQSLRHTASGGEMSRVMLCLKALWAETADLPTIIFDEIDTGVSGNVADRMAQMMRQMSGGADGSAGHGRRQVVSITHLPQIAARGEHHYRVFKQDTATETVSHIALLTPDERTEEIAHMLSGATLTAAAIDNARSLLQPPTPR